MNEQELQEIKERAEKATKGPWWWHDGEYHTTMPTLKNNENKEIMNFGDSEQFYPTEGTPPNDVDTEFISHAREDVPALIAEVERLREALENAQSEIIPIRGYERKDIDEITSVCIKIRNVLEGEDWE